MSVIVGFAYIIDTGCRAAFYLVLQAGSSAIFEYGIFTVPEFENTLKMIDGITYRGDAGKGAVKLTFSGLRCAAIHPEPWKCMSGQLNIGVALVIPKQDVVTRV